MYIYLFYSLCATSYSWSSRLIGTRYSSPAVSQLTGIHRICLYIIKTESMYYSSSTHILLSKWTVCIFVHCRGLCSLHHHHEHNQGLGLKTCSFKAQGVLGLAIFVLVFPYPTKIKTLSFLIIMSKQASNKSVFYAMPMHLTVHCFHFKKQGFCLNLR
jgi:hypothetical protein